MCQVCPPPTPELPTTLSSLQISDSSSWALPRRFGSRNPFAFMELQDVQELSNFFERTVSAYQVGVEGEVSFDEDF